MKNTSIACLLSCSLLAASLTVQAGPFVQTGMTARLYIELPLERVGGRTQGPSIGFALNHHEALDGNAYGLQTSGFSCGFERSWAGVDIPLLDVRMDAQKASLRRVNIVGTDVLAMTTRMKADGGPAVDTNEDPTWGKGDILAAVILVGVVDYVYYQAERIRAMPIRRSMNSRPSDTPRWRS
jgi:hypothetical protein